MKLLSDTYKNIVGQTKYLQNSCAYAQKDLIENRQALILYCQQFAFAKEMVIPCRRILDNRSTQLPFRFNFSGAYENLPYAFAKLPQKVQQQPYSKPSYPEPSYKPEPKPEPKKKNPFIAEPDPHVLKPSNYKPQEIKHDDPNAKTSHGIKLKIVGGNVKTHPHVDAVLAASAVSPTESVV